MWGLEHSQCREVEKSDIGRVVENLKKDRVSTKEADKPNTSTANTYEANEPVICIVAEDPKKHRQCRKYGQTRYRHNG